MLKRILVAAAIAGFAIVLASPAAMASKRPVPQGSVTFFMNSPSLGSVSHGARMSAGQKKQRLLVPAVQMVRCASRKC
jgi:hypothetical protein